MADLAADGGGSATPATPGSFSGAVNVVVPSSRATTMDLSNLNVVPMDIDGDGRSDLLHMPRFANYGYFMPTRDADDIGSTAGAAASPANQGWRFSYIPVALPTGVTDPRIDLGRDGAHIRAFDVNNDHLVDVVRTSGTVMQTWLNLGWLPGGEGRFGSATFVGGGSGGTGTWTLSTAPLESCVLYAGVPTDFEDPEVRLGDMNGDGIQDIVRIRRGRILYWPGRGLSPDGGASWGEGEQRCDRGEGADRYIEMATPPMELNTELDGVYIEDVNEDGAADVVQVRFDAIDVWFNRAGRSFTARVIADGTPARPAFLAGRIRFADMDGSGTVDVLYGNANDYRWVDLMGGVRPRLLTRVDNGLGALTSLEYGSSAEEYLRDLREASTSCRRPGDCRDRFTWSHVEDVCDTRVQRLTRECVHRSGGAPLVVQVVTAVETTDRLSVLGRENTVSRTEYAFHDGYYEGFEQEFRGFGAADATSLATGPSDTHPNGTTRSYFLQGRRPNAISTDRLADNPYESLKARVYLTETWDPEDGVTLSTGYSGYTVRQLVTGLDGRPVWFAFASSTVELRYDTSLGAGAHELVGSYTPVRFEAVGPSGAIPTTATSAEPDRDIYARWDGAILLISAVETMDNIGHATRSASYGRVLAPDEVITSVANVALVPGTPAGTWMWRPTTSWTEGSMSTPPTTRFGETTRTYNATGDLRLTSTNADLPITHPTGFDFGSLAQTNQTIIASSTFDVWGNATASCGGANLAISAASACLRYGTVGYDGDYSQFPLTEVIFTGPSSSLTTTGTWDRGLGVLRSVTDPNNFMTNVGYDGFGRVTFVRPPSSDGCTSTMPVQHFTYLLSTDPAASPISTVIAYQENGCTPLFSSVIETRTYVDGLGRARATLSTAESPGQWIQSGIALMNGRGTVRRTFQPERFSFGTNPTPTQALIVPSTPNELSGYDAFDRPTLRMPPMGGVYFTTYHALTRDECDPLDNGGALPFMDTCTTIRLDGHGRVIDQILRNRQPGGPMEYYRLFTTYRADGAVTVIQRAETTSDTNFGAPGFSIMASVSRTFTYDTAGRRIGTTDPDSDSYDVARTPRNSTWRYLFNPVGDLVAVRDPRGCGQDFFYDRAARLIAEDYIGCVESSFMNETTDLDLPLGSIGLTAPLNDLREVDVLYEFDTLPTWATTLGPGGAYLGRLGGVSDRGERSVMAYDARGQVVWTARQMAVIRAAPTLTIGTGADGRPTVSAAPTPSIRVYDTVASHTYVRTADYDHGGRPLEMTLPIDPDYGGTAPQIGGRLTYNPRGLPSSVTLLRGAVPHPVISDLSYTRDGLVSKVTYGDTVGGARAATYSEMTYDDRRRPTSMLTIREPTAIMTPSRPMGAVTIPFAHVLTWDTADNLTRVDDNRIGAEWPDGYRAQNVAITHDALYRVVSADYDYRADDNKTQPTDTAINWRTEAALTRPNDPMRSDPAPMMDGLPASRPINMTWEYDWLGNAEEWTDDAHQFYERSIGDIVNGSEDTTMERPGSLQLSTDFNGPSTDLGGWLEVDYGEDGNATAMTVHADCTDAPTYSCKDPGGSDLDARRAAIRTRCTCAQEQHYLYRWDEVNRIAEAMRFDRSGGSGGWTLMVRQRYLYDSANERTVKQTLDQDAMSSRPEAVALYVYPGDFERRGLYRSVSGTTYDAHSDAETQYVVGGARLVWRTGTRSPTVGVDRDQRLTIGLSDLIQSTNVTLDLLTGELVETGNYYANGARESYRSGTSGERSAAEPMGFTGKEADEEVGLTYFGQRYLMAHLGRWASPDPLQTHNLGGGEAINGYHYVAGSVLQAVDELGLDPVLIGRVYRINGTLGGVPVTYTGSTSRELVSRFSGHRWQALVRDPATTVTVRRVYAELDIEASGRGTARSALNEALRAPEQMDLEASASSGAEVLNEGNAAVDPETWATRHSVTTDEPTVAPRSSYLGPRVLATLNGAVAVTSVFTLMMDSLRITEGMSHVECAMPEQILWDENGGYTTGVRVEGGWGANFVSMLFGAPVGELEYYRTYVDGLRVGDEVVIDAETYAQDRSDFEALWGTWDPVTGATPGILEPNPTPECTDGNGMSVPPPGGA